MTKFHMMKTLTGIVIMLIACIFLGSQACNPDCSSATSRNIIIDPGTSVILEGRENQILLRSQPANLLLERSIFIDDVTKGPPSRTELREKNFVQELNGVVVTIPQEIATISTPAIYVDDPDCSGEVTLVNTLPIRDTNFFYLSDAFVVPPMPVVIVPTTPVLPPTNITNAWITPYDRTYCIWFVPELEVNENGDTVELPELRPFKPETDHADVASGKFTRIGSHEFVVCGTQDRNSGANMNPVSGFVDRENGTIEFRINSKAPAAALNIVQKAPKTT